MIFSTPGNTLRVSAVRSSALAGVICTSIVQFSPKARSNANRTASSMRCRACIAGFPVLTSTLTTRSDTAWTVTHSKDTTSLPSSGSITPFSASNTASSVHSMFIQFRILPLDPNAVSQNSQRDFPAPLLLLHATILPSACSLKNASAPKANPFD